MHKVSRIECTQSYLRLHLVLQSPYVLLKATSYQLPPQARTRFWGASPERATEKPLLSTTQKQFGWHSTPSIAVQSLIEALNWVPEGVVHL